ncbi:MAG: hypothetical protein QM451_11445 [Bacillota bacterium]|nr:hypothetical protein [Bacillota bacterium]HHT90222.1 hypothetical protein [Bacillota bacterium]
MMEIKQGTKSSYVGGSEDRPLDAMTYVLFGEDRILIDHTFVTTGGSFPSAQA